MTIGQRVTIREIAEEAGVSTQTVSRVINNRPDVSPTTRDKIQAVIKRTGYHPSTLARGLARGSTRTIGVILSGLPLYGPSQALAGVDRQAQARGYDTIVSLIHSPDDIPNAIQRMRGMNVAGIIWAVTATTADSFKQFADMLLDLPMPLIVNTTTQHERFTNVEVDNYLGGCLATSHLIEEGYRHIGVITGDLRERPSKLRLAGWRDTLQKHHFDVDENLIFNGNWTASSGYAGLQEIVRRQPNCDAIFASNDQMALGVLRAAAELGLEVPDAFGVVGYDDIPEAQFFNPPLTTVHQDLIVSGRQAIDELVRCIEDSSYQPTAHSIKVMPNLIVRQSSQRRREAV